MATEFEKTAQLAELLSKPGGKVKAAEAAARANHPPPREQSHFAKYLVPPPVEATPLLPPLGGNPVQSQFNPNAPAIPSVPPIQIDQGDDTPIDQDALMRGLAGVRMPQQIAPQIPRGTAPLPRLGGQIDPRLLAQIQAIFQPQPEIKGPPSALGGLITGGR